MNRIRKGVILFIAAAIVIFLTGCLEYGSWTIRYELDSDLEGVLILDFENVKDEDIPAEEMDEYIEELKRNEALLMAQMFGILEPAIEAEQAGIGEYNITITGEFENFIGSISALMVDSEEVYIKRNEKFIHVIFSGFEDAGDAEGMKLQIRYPGQVLKHNAQEFDTETSTITWHLDSKECLENGVEFKLSLSE